MAHFEDYVVLPGYNPQDAYHRELVQASKSLLGVVTYYTHQEYIDALQESGLETIHRVNGSVAEQTALLEQDKAFFVPLTNLVTQLRNIGIVPKHFADMMERMTRGTDETIMAHKLHLITG